MIVFLLFIIHFSSSVWDNPGRDTHWNYMTTAKPSNDEWSVNLVGDMWTYIGIPLYVFPIREVAGEESLVVNLGIGSYQSPTFKILELDLNDGSIIGSAALPGYKGYEPISYTAGISRWDENYYYINAEQTGGGEGEVRIYDFEKNQTDPWSIFFQVPVIPWNDSVISQQFFSACDTTKYPDQYCYKFCSVKIDADWPATWISDSEIAYESLGTLFQVDARGVIYTATDFDGYYDNQIMKVDLNDEGKTTKVQINASVRNPIYTITVSNVDDYPNYYFFAKDDTTKSWYLFAHEIDSDEELWKRKIDVPKGFFFEINPVVLHLSQDATKIFLLPTGGVNNPTYLYVYDYQGNVVLDHQLDVELCQDGRILNNGKLLVACHSHKVIEFDMYLLSDQGEVEKKIHVGTTEYYIPMLVDSSNNFYYCVSANHTSSCHKVSAN